MTHFLLLTTAHVGRKTCSKLSVFQTNYLELFFIFVFAEYLEKSYESIPNTAPFDVTGHPALSINAGLSDGLPVGMMIVGKKFDEATVLNVAYTYEKIRDATN